MLDVVAAGETAIDEAESDSAPARVVKRRGRPPKSAIQSSLPSTSTELATVTEASALTQPNSSPKTYNLRSRKN